MAARVKTLSRTFVWILMGLLILGLAGFGAVNLSGTVRTVAEVGDETVSVDAYARELQREIRAVEAQTGEPLPMTRARELGLDRIALSRLIALASLDNEVGQLGVSIGDENLQQEIVGIPA
ncbi:SurA N-terminal domain-containing protein, partial [Cribrihabitans sp. XS_ASV171]